MYRDDYELEAGANKANINFAKLPATEVVQIRAEVINRFGDKTKRSGFLWERFGSPNVHAVGDEVYLWYEEFLDTFLLARPAIIYFYAEQPMSALKFNTGHDLAAALRHVYIRLDEVCVTDENFSFILCLDHESGLTACGAAMPWLEEKILRLNEERRG